MSASLYVSSSLDTGLTHTICLNQPAMAPRRSNQVLGHVTLPRANLGAVNSALQYSFVKCDRVLTDGFQD